MQNSSVDGFKIEDIKLHVEQQAEELLQLKNLMADQLRMVQELGTQLQTVISQTGPGPMLAQLEMLNPRLRRNFIPNDDAAIHKLLMANWELNSATKISYKELIESGFRVFSQNDEDGILLRIFSHIGCTNKCVVEIGSNCHGSDIGIPENMSTNLVVNHGWHGAIFEMDSTECQRMQYFFARDYATKNFHMQHGAISSYFSPLVVQAEVTPQNINQLLKDARCAYDPDLFVIDIDGGDYDVVQSMQTIRPRVMVVEFERRFRDSHSVVQSDRNNFSQLWPQSGAASLLAWIKLLGIKGYTLCAIGTCGFNAFFVRNDVATEKITALDISIAFDEHPLLSKVTDEFWLTPDDTWKYI